MPSLQTVPSALAEVALIDAKAVAAAAGISISTLHELVRQGLAPKGIRFGARCTRWRVSAVREWLEHRIAEAEADSRAEVVTTARAKKASDAAKTRRVAGAEAVAVGRKAGKCAPDRAGVHRG